MGYKLLPELELANTRVSICVAYEECILFFFWSKLSNKTKLALEPHPQESLWARKDRAAG